MKKFILKTLLYGGIILIVLEIIVRVFHLYTVDPPRFIDEYGVEKRVPKKTGFAVTGNRNQNFSEFEINSSGFNSHREFVPTEDKFEVALIGDSFIEGFHQDYYNSTGKKIEDLIPDGEVYEYGYAGYDLANQMHLVDAYKEEFKYIDEIILYLNYENDLGRGEYEPNYERISRMSSTLFTLRDKIKILAYGSKIGVLAPIKDLMTGKEVFNNNRKGYETNKIAKESEAEKLKKDMEYLDNFKHLVALYGFDKSKTSFLLDSRKTSKSFLDYCKENGYNYIDFAEEFKDSGRPTNLIYDAHWNNNGRQLIAQVIVDYINKKYDYFWLQQGI